MSDIALPIQKRSELQWRLILLLAILVGLIGIDQYSKQLAVQYLKNSPATIYFDGAVRLQYAENPGAFLGLGGQLSSQSRFILFSLMNGFFLSLILILLWKQWNMPLNQFVALAVLLAGGIGNLIDRLSQQGMVTDFLNLGVGTLRTGIFNVADIAITMGIILLCFNWNSSATQELTVR